MSDEKVPRFGATDFYLLDADPAAVRSELRDAIAEYLGYTPAESDPLFVVCMALMPYIVQTRALADAAAKSTLLTYAIGQNLDRIADATCAVGYLDRFPARPAYCPIRLYLIGALPAATESSADVLDCRADVSFEFKGLNYTGSMHWDIVKSYSLLDLKYHYGPSLVYIDAFCDVPGVVGNITSIEAAEGAIVDAIRAGQLSVKLDGSDITDQIETITCDGAAGGKDAEDDAAFAERIRLRQAALRIPGSVEYYADLIHGMYGLRDYKISRKAFTAREGHEEDDARFAGAVAVYYIGDSPIGAQKADDPVEPGTDQTLKARLRETLAYKKLVSDKVMLTEAKATDIGTAVYEVHYSVFSDASEDTLLAIRRAYEASLDKYCNKLGIVVDFDDFVASLTQAGAFDAHIVNALVPILPVQNIDMYDDEFLPASYITLVRDADAERNDTMTPGRSPVSMGSQIIV